MASINGINCTDVERAIIKTMHLKSEESYSEYSKCIYQSTDNIRGIINTAENIDKCLIPTGSGECAIELATFGSEVFTYDINFLSEYIQELRIAGIKKLDYSDFIKFFIGIEPKKFFSEEIYSDMRSSLSDKARTYFDTLFNIYSPKEIVARFLDIDYQDIISTANSALNGAKHYFSFYHEDGFYTAKELDLLNKIHFIQTDILNIRDTIYDKENDFDLICFSNILLFLDSDEQNEFYNLLENYFYLKLKDYGTIVNYFHSFGGETRNGFISGNISEYQMRRELDAFRLSLLSDTFVDIGEGHNGIGYYNNDVIHLIKK